MQYEPTKKKKKTDSQHSANNINVKCYKGLYLHTFLREVSGCFSVCGSSKGLGSSGAISSTLIAHKRIDSEMDFMQITEQEDLAHKHFWLLTLCKQKEREIHVVMPALQPWTDTDIPQSK